MMRATAWPLKLDKPWVWALSLIAWVSYGKISHFHPKSSLSTRKKCSLSPEDFRQMKENTEMSLKKQ